MARCDAGEYFDSGIRLDAQDSSAAGPQVMKIATGMRGASELEQVTRVRSYATGMTGNAHFPNAAALVAEATDAADNTVEAINNYDTAVSLCAMRLTQKRAALQALRGRATSLVGHVISVADDNPEVAQSANMTVVFAAAPIGELLAPADPVATTNGLEGVIKLRWAKVTGAKNYVVQRTTNPNDPATWQQIAMPPRTSFKDEELTSGTKYWYRVAANGAAGLSPWSAVVSKVAA